jgi:MSHA biogenesis protein MshG
MLKFKYTGTTKDGKTLTGVIEAAQHEHAVNSLRQKGIVITSINVVTVDESDFGKKIVNLLFRRKVNNTDLVLFCRQMHSLAKAGIPIIGAIKAISGNMENPIITGALEHIITELEAGNQLHQCMSKHPHIFPPVMLALIDVGENTGNLDEVFKQLSLHLEREEKTVKLVLTSLRYPTFVIITMALAMVIVNVMVIPAFSGFFSKFGADLPLPTRILLGVSSFTVHKGGFILAGVAGLVIWWLSFIKTKVGKLFWDTKKLQIPLLGSIIKKSILARFARSFALTSRAGVPLLSAISLIADTSDNAYISHKILDMRSFIEHGGSLTEAAEKSKMFTSLVMQMISIGEQTGEMDRLLEEVASFYEEELDYELSKLSASIEPILIVIIAAMVLVLALGIFLPMWDISSATMKNK